MKSFPFQLLLRNTDSHPKRVVKVTGGGSAAGGSMSLIATDVCRWSRAAEQQSSREAQQRSSAAAEQRSSRAAEQSCHLFCSATTPGNGDVRNHVCTANREPTGLYRSRFIRLNILTKNRNIMTWLDNIKCKKRRKHIHPHCAALEQHFYCFQES